MKPFESGESVQSDGGPVLSNDGSYPVLLYDGLCVMCNAAVRFVLRNDPNGQISFAPLDGEYAARIKAAFPALEGIDSVVLVTRDEMGVASVRTRSDAVIAVSRLLKGGRWYSRILGLVPRRLRDAFYDGVAATRYRIFGRHAACPLPPPGVRDRFLA